MWILDVFKIIGLTAIILMGIVLFTLFLPIIAAIAIAVFVGMFAYAAIILDPIKKLDDP